MLVVRVEVLPAGNPKEARLLEEVHITRVADEVGTTLHGVTRAGSDCQATVRYRGSDGALRLAWLALGALIGETIPDGSK